MMMEMVDVWIAFGWRDGLESRGEFRRLEPPNATSILHVEWHASGAAPSGQCGGLVGSCGPGAWHNRTGRTEERSGTSAASSSSWSSLTKPKWYL